MRYKEKAIDFIANSMWIGKTVKTFAHDPTSDQKEYDDYVTYTTGLTGLLLSELKNPNKKLVGMLKAMSVYIHSELIASKFWMWSALHSDLRKFIPLDIDTSSINSEFLRTQGIHLENHNALSKNQPKDKQKGFYSWIIPRKSYLRESIKTMYAIYRHSFYRRRYWKMTPSNSSECNDFMSVNLYHYMVINDRKHLQEAEDFLNQFDSIDDMHDIYYRNKYLNYYFASRVLKYSTNKDLRVKFTPQIKDTKPLSDLELSSVILAFKELGLDVPSDWRLDLKSRQLEDGSWNKYDVFTFGGNTTWRSPGLNAALALAALE